jgi:6-phosphogluconolactonase (cycloisomerase 2 family)
LVFHPKLDFVYCIEELSGTIATYSYNEGKLNLIERIFACKEIKEVYSSADIHISPDGLFLYASNRGENTIAIFSINQTNGLLTLLAHEPTYGNTPRNFTIDPSGRFILVANQQSNNIIVFKRDTITGMLSKTATEISIPNPSCLKMKTY